MDKKTYIETTIAIILIIIMARIYYWAYLKDQIQHPHAEPLSHIIALSVAGFFVIVIFPILMAFGIGQIIRDYLR